MREFLFRLALKLGIWDVDELARKMPMSLFWEWLAFYRISPWGDEWRQSGRLAAVVAGASGCKIDHTFEDRFMPTGGRYRGMNQTEIEMLEELRKIGPIREQIDKRR